ncbi:MAG: serine acetyltransferase, partial [Desulfobacterales bacterium]|nr:serine acetyltransferase [Desulfobacterales bacterium]
MKKKELEIASCKRNPSDFLRKRDLLPEIIDNITNSINQNSRFNHIDYEPIPSRSAVIDIIFRLRDILFPGYFNKEKIDPINLKYYLGQAITNVFDLLSVQISYSIRHECFRYNLPCGSCDE